MSILNIRPAKRGGSKAIIGIAGVSGSGKTFTALLIARGMVDKASEIGFLDTENKRGSMYADILDGHFMIGDLYPPFSPKRYSEAIKEFQDAGVKVLVIDSVSHEWEGEGGCDDIANASLESGKKMANWIGAKREHKSFMNTILQCNMNVICCIRAREKTDFKNPAKPVSLGIQPVCEKNFMFEMTASLLMENEGKTQKFLKIPAFLKKAFGTGDGYLDQNTGKQLIEWINEGEQEDPEITKCKSELLMACELGIAGLTALWNKLTPELQKKMKPHFSVYKESAKAYDEQALAALETPQDELEKNKKNSTLKLELP
ncbi:MAG: hypothetical protein JWO92_2501 [Chitinophagaceae bacterium]|nr:hypothetical protein [Chitinophagaceae bacterium]